MGKIVVYNCHNEDHTNEVCNFYIGRHKNPKTKQNDNPLGNPFTHNGVGTRLATLSFKTREDEPFVIGNHEETSEFIIRQFIPLRISESAAIMHHHGSLGWDSVPVDVMSKVYNKYTLVLLLHEADLLAAYKFV